MSAEPSPVGAGVPGGIGAPGPGPAPGAPLLAEEIRAGYGGGDIIQGVSVRVEPGQVAAIIGPNGSGKSTLL